MITLWLQTAVAFGFALAAWISGLDANGAAIDSALLWGASALAGAFVVFRALARAR
jgi:hypothetical protein